ncbi:putative F-box/FBD-like domain protein, partial [Trifolium pratense]
QQNLDEDTQMLDPISDVLVDQGVVRQPVEDLPGKSKDFIEYVKSTLLRFSDQKLVIKEFNLRVDWFEVSSMSMDVDICLKLASENGVQVLELSNGRYKLEKDWGDCYVLPEKVIENQKLTKLSLVGGIRVDRAFTNHSIKFFSLRELYLLNVHFEDEQSIENLISCCPLIEIIILIFDRDGMESLRMDGLQKLKTVYTDGIKELYIDEVPSLESLYYCGHLDTPFKFDSIRCQNLKELFLILNRTTIITNKWFLELFQKFRFLERLKLLCCETSETINISSGQLKFLRLSFGSNLKEANIDAPNLSSYFVVSLLLCCVPTNISLNLDACGRAFIEFLYETLMRKKEDDCFCGSSDTKCWWHNLKDVKINSYFKIDKINDVDFKTMLESFPTFRPRDISIRLEF